MSLYAHNEILQTVGGGFGKAISQASELTHRGEARIRKRLLLYQQAGEKQGDKGRDRAVKQL